MAFYAFTILPLPALKNMSEPKSYQKMFIVPKLEQRSYPLTPTLHKHTFHQVVLPRRGRMEIEISGSGGFVDTQHAAFVPSGERHTFASKEENAFIVLDIPNDYIQSVRNGHNVLDYFSSQKFFPLTAPLQHLIGYAGSLKDNTDASEISEAWANLFMEAAFQSASDTIGLRSRHISNACRYIEKHLSNSITISTIAREVGVSERRLHALFLVELKTTPHAYLMHRRAQYALSLLARTSKAISDIAILSGYADQSALTRFLRQTYNITPSAYRKKIQKGKSESLS